MYNCLQMWPSRNYVNYVHPDPATIDIEDIAHHLSMETRFCGGSPAFFSVAQHCVDVSMDVKTDAPYSLGPWAMAALGLLHEAGEAFCKDLPTPLKYMPGLETYRHIEVRMRNAAIRKLCSIDLSEFGVGGMYFEVKAADERAFERELAWINGGKPIDAWSPRRAKLEFLDRWYRVERGLVNERQAVKKA